MKKEIFDATIIEVKNDLPKGWSLLEVENNSRFQRTSFYRETYKFWDVDFDKPSMLIISITELSKDQMMNHQFVVNTSRRCDPSMKRTPFHSLTSAINYMKQVMKDTDVYIDSLPEWNKERLSNI